MATKLLSFAQRAFFMFLATHVRRTHGQPCVMSRSGEVQPFVWGWLCGVEQTLSALFVLIGDHWCPARARACLKGVGRLTRPHLGKQASAAAKGKEQLGGQPVH